MRAWRRPTAARRSCFLGPTGVGKTELAKALAELLFGDEKLLIRLDMGASPALPLSTSTHELLLTHKGMRSGQQGASRSFPK